MADALGAPGAMGAPVIPRPAGFARAGAALAASSIVANLLGYAFAVVLSRALGPDSYGALAALLAMGLIGSIPAIALQLLVARELASTDAGPAIWIRTSVVIGAALTLLFAILAPFAQHYLGLTGPAPVIWMGLALLPTTIAGALQGVLLGRRRYVALAASYLLLAGLRFAGGSVAAAIGTSVSGALAAATIGTIAACLLIVGVTAAGETLRWTSRDGTGGPSVRQRVDALAAAASATAAILVLTNLDVVLARHFLPPADSGQYGVGALFAKAAFWAPHFLAVLAYPLLANGRSRRGPFVISASITLAIGAVVVLGAVLFAGPVVEMTVGQAYSDGAALAPEFAALGVLAAVLQLLLFAGLARRTRRAELLVWTGIAAELLIVSTWLHASSEQIVFTSMAVCAALSIVIVGDELRWRARAQAAEMAAIPG